MATQIDIATLKSLSPDQLATLMQNIRTIEAEDRFKTMTVDQLKAENEDLVVKNLHVLDMSKPEIAKYLMQEVAPMVHVYPDAGLDQLKFQYEKYSVQDLVELACIAIDQGNKAYFEKHFNAYRERKRSSRIGLTEADIGAMVDKCSDRFTCKTLMTIVGDAVFVCASEDLKVKILMSSQGWQSQDILDFARYLVLKHCFSANVFDMAIDALARRRSTRTQQASLMLLCGTGKALCAVQAARKVDGLAMEKYV